MLSFSALCLTLVLKPDRARQTTTTARNKAIATITIIIIITVIILVTHGCRRQQPNENWSLALETSAGPPALLYCLWLYSCLLCEELCPMSQPSVAPLQHM